jgi:hypothetical protein
MNGGAISPLPHTFSWRGDKLIKHRDNFAFYKIEIKMLIVPIHWFRYSITFILLASINYFLCTDIAR